MGPRMPLIILLKTNAIFHRPILKYLTPVTSENGQLNKTYDIVLASPGFTRHHCVCRGDSVQIRIDPRNLAIRSPGSSIVGWISESCSLLFDFATEEIIKHKELINREGLNFQIF